MRKQQLALLLAVLAGIGAALIELERRIAPFLNLFSDPEKPPLADRAKSDTDSTTNK